MTPTPPLNRAPDLNWVYAIVFFLSLVVIGVGVVLGVRGAGWAMLAAGCASTIAVLITWPLSRSMQHVDAAIDRAVQPVLDQLTNTVATLNKISQQQLISDRAKQLAFREKDREAFKQAIADDVQRGDFQAAMALIDAMETGLGFKSDADKLRADLQGRLDAQQDRQIEDARLIISRLMDMEQWQAAVREGERLASLFPDQVRAVEVTSEIETRRQVMKKQLIARWHEQVRHKQIDDAIVTLKKLDVYLTPVEAAGLEDDARMIFKEKLASLRDAFTAAVQRGDWSEAMRQGEIIRRDFASTQMAREVSEMWATLESRRKAADQPDAVGAV
jgi:hypothetical protein